MREAIIPHNAIIFAPFFFFFSPSRKLSVRLTFSVRQFRRVRKSRFEELTLFPRNRTAITIFCMSTSPRLVGRKSRLASVAMSRYRLSVRLFDDNFINDPRNYVQERVVLLHVKGRSQFADVCSCDSCSLAASLTLRFLHAVMYVRG